MMDEWYEEEPRDLPHVPRIEIGSIETIEDIELELQSNHDDFYRRIVTYIIDSIEGNLPEDGLKQMVDLANGLIPQYK